MGTPSKLLQRANPANAANRSASQHPDSHDSQPSHALQRMRKELRCTASAEGLPVSLVAGLPDAEVLGCDGCPANSLRVYLRILAHSQHMAAGGCRMDGRAPQNVPAAALCRCVRRPRHPSLRAHSVCIAKLGEFPRFNGLR